MPLDFVLELQKNSNCSLLVSFIQYVFTNYKTIIWRQELEPTFIDKIIFLKQFFSEIESPEAFLCQIKENLIKKFSEIQKYSNEINNFIGNVYNRMKIEIYNNVQRQQFIENEILKKLRANFFIKHVIINLELSREKKILLKNKNTNLLEEQNINKNQKFNSMGLSE